MDKELIQSGMVSLVRPMRGLWRTACQFLWPALCQACLTPIEEDAGGLCSTCWRELSTAVGSDYCRRCGRAVTRYGLVANRCGGCLEEELEYEGLCRAGFYAGVLKNLLLGLKFRDQTENADYLGPILQGAFEASGFSDKIDILVPVPLHWRRRLERGFNQSYLLACQMRRFCSTISTDLVRMRYTCHQWELENDSARRKNVKDAFAVRDGHPFQGKTVCLVDDITTSGATLKECAATLHQAGAKAVYAAVVAVAERMD